MEDINNYNFDDRTGCCHGLLELREAAIILPNEMKHFPAFHNTQQMPFFQKRSYSPLLPMPCVGWGRMLTGHMTLRPSGLTPNSTPMFKNFTGCQLAVTHASISPCILFWLRELTYANYIN